MADFVSLASSRTTEFLRSVVIFSMRALIFSTDSAVLSMFSMFATIAGSFNDSIISRAVGDFPYLFKRVLHVRQAKFLYYLDRVRCGLFYVFEAFLPFAIVTRSGFIAKQ
ncbi:MAG TPA: hypothetical protein VGJ42_01945 [Nitrososphaera sp.]